MEESEPSIPNSSEFRKRASPLLNSPLSELAAAPFKAGRFPVYRGALSDAAEFSSIDALQRTFYSITM
jgi:hypothetical protein